MAEISMHKPRNEAQNVFKIQKLGKKIYLWY